MKPALTFSMTWSLLPALCAILLSGCGTTSEMRPAASGASPVKKYRSVYVEDLGTTGAETDVGPSELEWAGTQFAEMIAGNIMKQAPGAEVLRSGQRKPEGLTLSGNITQYVEGSAAARYLVGMGVGNCNLEANLYLRENATGKTVGTVKVDQFGYIMGGMIASVQKPRDLIRISAPKVGEEVAKYLE